MTGTPNRVRHLEPTTTTTNATRQQPKTMHARMNMPMVIVHPTTAVTTADA
eukprot:m.75686 g.75686  ORF g.75686 m.75686 type:complete len:51 (+) comp24815_c0_seq1:488-640(+)